MANNPKKIQDPAESALSAIQEALGTRTGLPPTVLPMPSRPRLWSTIAAA